MIVYDEDGNDVNLSGKPPHHTNVRWITVKVKSDGAIIGLADDGRQVRMRGDGTMEPPVDDPRGRVMKIGEEIATFGTLKSVNPRMQSATFKTPTGENAEISAAAMVSTIAAGLAKAGAISLDAAEGVSKALREDGVSGNPAVTPEYIIDLIVQAIYAEPDQFVAAGQWITRLTLAIGKIAQEAPDES